VALAPAAMFERELDESRLVRPLSTEVMTGSYWLVRLKSRKPSAAMEAFRRWLADYIEASSIAR
jgi:LysR family transcriptional regulator, regulator of gene expression of beta-lactamase